MAKLFNRAKMTTTTTGSGTITLGSASNGFQSFADAGVADGDVVQYVIEEGANFEIGTGTYSSSGTSLTRSPSESSNSDNAITLAGQATVSITATHADFNRLQHGGSDKVTVSSTGASVTGNLAVSGNVDGVDVSAFKSSYDSHNHDDRYYTETEADSRFVNTTGDTITSGSSTGLTINHDTFGEGLVIHRNDASNSAAIQFKNNTGKAGVLWANESGGQLYWRERTGTTNHRVFHDNYHPNADKWTTSRTLSLTGGVTGSVSWDGSANASLTSTVALATASAVGGIKIGYSENGKNYPVELDSNGKAYVNVPWTDTNTDTNTTYSLKAQQTDGNDTNPNILLDASSGTDDTIQLVGAGATTVTRNSDGQITISSTDTDTTVTNFNSLTNKTGGTGEYSTSSHLTSGRGSGGVSLTINDGYGNANVTWNHKNGTPEQNGQSARIEVNTDSTTGEGTMSFEVSSAAVTSGTAVNLPVGMTLAHDYVEIPNRIRHAGDTNTYMEFHGGDSWRVVTGGTERLEATNSGIRIDDAFTLPTTDGSANQVLTTDGSGNVSWTTQIDTNTNTNQLTTFVVQDGDSTNVTMGQGKYLKFAEGGAIDVNFTDTNGGTSGDPYDLTISHADTSSQGSVNNSNGTVIQDVTLDGYGHVTALGSVNLDNRYTLKDHIRSLGTTAFTGGGQTQTLRQRSS